MALPEPLWAVPGRGTGDSLQSHMVLTQSCSWGISPEQQVPSLELQWLSMGPLRPSRTIPSRKRKLWNEIFP